MRESEKIFWTRKLNEAERAQRAAPVINVTPLIDVLLVLLIIFMVASPLRPSRFRASIPEPPTKETERLPPNKNTLVVSVDEDLNLKLNGLEEMGSVNDTAKLSEKLVQLFQERTKNHDYRYGMDGRTDVPEEQRVEKTVFIKAPRSIKYGAVARLIDGIKGAGAEPVGLQIDGLN
jgi:biopolymer transport protein ExbD